MKLTKTALPFTPIEDYTLEQAIVYRICRKVYPYGHWKMVTAMQHDSVAYVEACTDVVCECYDVFIKDEILYSFTDQIDTVNILISENAPEYFKGKMELDVDEIGKVFKYPEANRYA